MSACTFRDYVVVCAILLARAHSQNANASTLRRYLGASNTVHDAIAEWSFARIRRQVARRLHQLSAAAAAGDIEVADDPAW